MIAAALMMAGVALIFATDLHHLIIGSLLMSYDVFPLGQMMPGDLAQNRPCGQSGRASISGFL